VEAADKVLSIIARNTPANAAGSNAFIGINGMSATDGWTMKPDEASPPINFREIGGSVRADSIYFDHGTSAEEVEFIVVLE